MTTPEILGYPRDARLLIVNIDDYGLCYTVNNTAIQLLKAGAACSCTVMAPAPWGIHGIELVKASPGVKCGVHLTAISEHRLYRWRPLSSPESVPSLIDEDGFFYLESRQEQFTQGVVLSELEHEWRAQIEFVRQRGVQVTHLDSHCNVHDSRDDIFEMTFHLALEYGLPLRVHNPRNLAWAKVRGRPTIDFPDLDSFSLPLEDKTSRYLRMLQELPEGLSEWGIHPAYESDELRAITPEWPVRSSDFGFFSSADYQHMIRNEGIELVDYSILKSYWAT